MILDASCQLDYQTSEEVPAIFMLRPRSGWAQWIMREEFHTRPHVPVMEFAVSSLRAVPRPGGGYRG
jgi:hypothetical protein